MSLTLKSLCSRLISVRVRSVPMRVSRPAVRPIVLPVALPTVPRVVAFGSRTLVVLLVPIVLPIRELEFTVRERWFVADCFFVTDIDGSLLPIILPIPRPRSVRSVELLLFILDEIEGLVELTAGCFATVGAEELRVPIELPIRERWLVVGCFFAFEAGGVLRLLELPILEAPLELAAGWFAPLGTDGLVVLIVLPIREVMLGLTRLLVLVLSEVEVLLRVLVVGLFVVVVREGLLDGVLILIELPIRDVMLESILPLEFVLSEAEELLRVLKLLRLDGAGVGELGRVVICRPNVLELGAVGRELIDRLEVLVLGVQLVIALLEVLLLGARLVMALLDVLLLGVRLVVTLLVLRLDETLLELLDDGLDVALGAGAGFEACRVCLLELLDLLLDRVLAAKTGSAISARISIKRVKNRGWKVEDSFPASNFWLLASDFSICVIFSMYIIRLLSSALTS